MKNDNRNFFSPDLELFNGGSWGGRMGGAFALYWPMKLMDLPQFWKKDTFSRLHEGRSWGAGADGGVLKWRGGWGGATFRIHGGRWGVFQLLLKHFLTQNLRFFEMNVNLIS